LLQEIPHYSFARSQEGFLGQKAPWNDGAKLRVPEQIKKAGAPVVTAFERQPERRKIKHNLESPNG